jgi:hypothetical protein
LIVPREANEVVVLAVSQDDFITRKGAHDILDAAKFVAPLTSGSAGSKVDDYRTS